MTDIDELERLGAEAMSSPSNRDGSRCDWRVHESTELGSCVASAHGYTICGPIAGQSARYICALHNALPGLIAELRLARRNSREHDAAIGQANAGLRESSRRIVALEAELAALREVAEAATRAHSVIHFDLRKMLVFGPEFNQAVKDTADRLTAALAKVPRP